MRVTDAYYHKQPTGTYYIAQELYSISCNKTVKVKVARSCPTLCDPMDCAGQNTGVGSLSLLQGIFPTQGLNPGLLHCRRILYQLSHKGIPRILEWAAYPFSSGSSLPRNWTGVSWVAGRFFTNWAIREAHLFWLTLFSLSFQFYPSLPMVIFSLTHRIH